ncbi:MAG: rod shape-determining protein MreC [Oscillospiraceae bacterium]|nr:rod shape-determining protein MreC [Oscillospiraceae bacterium]
MKRFFTKNGMILLSAITAVAVGLCILSAISSGTGFLYNALGVVASPFRAAGGAVSGWVQGVTEHFQSVSDLQARNEELERRVAELEDQLRRAGADSEENQRLRNAMGLRQQRRDFTFASARVVSRSSSNWASTLTLSKGTAQDISIGDCVVDEFGYLVGVVTDAGLNWSTVTTVLDTDSQLGAMVFRTGEIAVAAGDLRLITADRLRLSYLSSESSLINGDLIVTSGLGGYFPAGLVIGSVEDILTDDSGLDRYAIVSPKANVPTVKEVFVITSFTVED